MTKSEKQRRERVGEEFISNKGKKFKIIEYINSRKVKVVDENGTTKFTTYGSLVHGNVSDKIPRHRVSKRFYVYFATFNNEIVYIGRGSQDRYKHVHSGCSHVYELNRHHFNNDYIECRIEYPDLSYEESKEKELELIRLHRPAYNKTGVT